MSPQPQSKNLTAEVYINVIAVVLASMIAEIVIVVLRRKESRLQFLTCWERFAFNFSSTFLYFTKTMSKESNGD
jgi:hypothetical protein